LEIRVDVLGPLSTADAAIADTPASRPTSAKVAARRERAIPVPAFSDMRSPHGGLPHDVATPVAINSTNGGTGV
jgi:hypothetical protein